MVSSALTVESVKWYVIKIPQPYRYSEMDEGVEFLPGTDYFIDYDWDQAYATNLESLLVKVIAEDGTCGWGEVQSPLVPEVGAALIDNLVGPLVLGQDAREVDRIRERLYQSMHVRGHYQGFMLDATSGLDIALWDLLGRAMDIPVSTLLGGRCRDRLPAYVSLPGFTEDELVSQTREYADEGFAGVKAFLGHGVDKDAGIVDSLRKEVGHDVDVYVDLFWSYTPDAARRLADRLVERDVGFVEAPLRPEDITGHARLTADTAASIAVGEPIRTCHEFKQWLDADALDIAQPDIVRTGLTEGRRIADLTQTGGRPVAPHFGAALGVGMAATWHLAATVSELLVQEHQPICFDETNELLDPGLRHEAGELIVPDRPGLGVDVDEQALEEVTADSGIVT